MRTPIIAFFFLIAGLFLSASGTALTINTGNDFYNYQDRIDSTKSGKDILFDFGLGLENIGGSGLSFITDMKWANVFHDGLSGSELRSPFELTTGYFDWRHSEGNLRFRLGRQQYTNLSVDAFDCDGFRTEIRPTLKSVINAVAGMYVPTPYVERTINRKFLTGRPDSLLLDTAYKTTYIGTPAKNGILLLDGAVSAIPFTTITAAAALVPKAFDKTLIRYDTLKVPVTTGSMPVVRDSIVKRTVTEKGDFRIALGANISPVPLLRLNGSGRFSAVQKGIDRFDGRITVIPTQTIELSTYIIGEKGRIDSTNYFSIMFHKQLTEFGITLNTFFEGGAFLQADYHLISIAGEGPDHFISFDASNRLFNIGGMLGAGSHGLTLRPYFGFRLPFWKIFSFDGAGEYCYVDETDDDNIHHLIVVSGGLKTAIHQIGLTIFPRIEYITNQYYAKDLRFLITTNLLIFHFWGGKE